MTDYTNEHNDLKFAYKQDSTNPLIANQLAIASMEVNDYLEAFKLFKRNAEINPSEQSLSNLAYFYFHEGEPEIESGGWINREEDAILLLERVMLLNPKSEVPSAMLGQFYFAKERWNEAKSALERSFSVKPTFLNQYNLAASLFQLGQLEEASEYYWKAHQVKNECYSYWALYYYAVCKIKTGSYPKEAIEELVRSMDDKNSEIDKEGLADIYYELDQYTNVVNAYEGTKLWVSPNWVLRYLYANVQCGFLDKAKDILNNALVKINEELINCITDEDEDFTPEDRERYKLELEADKRDYLRGYDDILHLNYRPSMNFTAYVESKCYLFGCKRHDNPDFLES
ncbi:CDC27 family protein [Paenibacillus sp. RS8]|uniref:CDC27 family protein n=1 Tax=Paenibacillus sp. RS8 TaxID=3242681 RepID=UPI0035C0E5AD